MKKIVVYLPHDRVHAGYLELEVNGKVVFNCGALGKADNAKAAKCGNPGRDPVRPWGDTPCGSYDPARVMTLPPPYGHLGKYFIPMEGTIGQAAEAKTNGRTGLGIHGGRGNDRLVPTNGCVRLLDDDMEALVELIDGDEVDIHVVRV